LPPGEVELMHHDVCTGITQGLRHTTGAETFIDKKYEVRPRRRRVRSGWLLGSH
jgi:hypothetical protein